MAIKIDLEKAFNKINWQFIKDMLNSIQIPTKLINIIMSCISSPELAILINGNPTQFFKPNRGVRQGDLLSPYLFILGMEYLSRLINYKITQCNWSPISITRKGPKISHTLFADDVLLFDGASTKKAPTISNVLNKFFSSSGLSTNINKSKIFFFNNCDDNLYNQISNTLTIKRVNNLKKYLGSQYYQTHQSIRISIR